MLVKKYIYITIESSILAQPPFYSNPEANLYFDILFKTVQKGSKFQYHVTLFLPFVLFSSHPTSFV